jgi:hypothetical protein
MILYFRNMFIAKKIKSKAIIFFISFAILFSINAPILWIDNAHHDVIRHFSVTNTNKICIQDPQHGWLKDKIARPFAAALECLVFKNVDIQQDLTFWRLIVLLILALANTMLITLLLKNSVKLLNAFLISTPIFILPGAINSVFMANIPNAIALLMSLISFFIYSSFINNNSKNSFFSKSRMEYAKVIMAFFILLSVMFTYPTLSFFFFIGTLITLMNNKVTNKESLRNSIYHIIFFIATSLIAIIVRTILYNDVGNIPIDFQSDFNLLNIFHRIFYFLPNIYIPSVFTLWFIDSQLLKLIVFLFFIACLYGLLKSFNLSQKSTSFLSYLKDSKISRLIFIIGVFLLTFTPLIIKGGGPQPFFRTLFVPMAAISLVILFYTSLENSRTILKINKNKFIPFNVSLLLYSFLTLIYINSSFHINKNTWEINAEMTFARNALASNDEEIKYIHIIRPVDNGIGYSGIKSYNDEFHRKTIDYSQDIFFFVKSAFESVYQNDKALIWCNDDLECKSKYEKDPRYILISFSNFEENFCRKQNMIIIDYNILVRATNTGNPNITNLQNVPICHKKDNLIK